MEYNMTEIFLAKDSWQDLLPAISFYEDDLDLSDKVNDLIADDSWMDLSPCCLGSKGN